MTSWPPPEDVRAAAEAHRELAPVYQDALIESFLDKISREIEARVDARIAQQQAGQPPGARGPSGPNPLTVALTSLALGIPFSAIAIAAGRHWTGALLAMTVAWIAIAVINVACNVGHHSQFRRAPTRR